MSGVCAGTNWEHPAIGAINSFVLAIHLLWYWAELWLQGGSAVELPKLKEVQLQYMDQWFSNLVDTMNTNLANIEAAVMALSMQLTNLDTAPFQYLRDSLNELVNNVNDGFEKIQDEFKTLDSRLKAIGG